VIAFYYKKRTSFAPQLDLPITIFPQNTEISITIYEKYNWQIGGEFINTIEEYPNRLGVRRLVEKDILSGNISVKLAKNHVKDTYTYLVDESTYNLLSNNCMLLKAIDSGTDEGKIAIEDIVKYEVGGLVSIPTSRNQIFLIFSSPIPLSVQRELLVLFNKYLNEKRQKYHSLFMTNYRDNNRKRISFDFVYKLLNYLYFEKLMQEVNYDILLGEAPKHENEPRIL
jgi:hypothetical protein